MAYIHELSDRRNGFGKDRFFYERVDPRTHLFPAELRLSQRLLASCSYLPEMDLEKIHVAVTFMFEGHQNQYRDEGQPYSTHPLKIAMELIKKYKVDATTICSALLHDTIEDTPITIEQIRAGFGAEVASTVELLSKTRGRYQRGELVAEKNRLGIIESLMSNIRVAVIKTYDRLHNMRTLGAKKEKKKREIIHETQQVYIPLARRMGLHKEANELENLCLIQGSLEHARWARSANRFIRSYFRQHSPVQASRELKSILKSKGFNAGLHYRLPTPADLYRRIGQLRPIQSKDMHLYIDAAQTDFAGAPYDPFQWGEQAVAIANTFTWLTEFDRITNIQALAFKHEVQSGLTDSLAVEIVRLRDDLLIKLRLYPTDVHVRERLPLAYLLSHTINQKPGLKTLLLQKQQYLAARLTEILQGVVESSQLVRQLEPSLPEGFMRVIGVNDKGEEEPWSIQSGSTVMDYIGSITPLSWQKAVAAYINGRRIEVPNYTLQPGDKVHIVYSRHGRYDPLWIHCFRTNPEKAELVREKIKQKRTMFESTKNFDDLYLLDHRIKRVGKWRLRTLAGLKSLLIGVERAMDSIQNIDPTMTADDFYLKVGLGELQDVELHPIIDMLVRANQDLLILSVDFERDTPGQDRLIGEVTEKLGINIVDVRTDHLGEQSIITIGLDSGNRKFVKKLAREIRKHEESSSLGLQAIRLSENHLGATEKLLYLRSTKRS